MSRENYYSQNVPKECEDVNRKIEILKFAERSLKSIPSLPSGKLKDDIVIEITLLIDPIMDQQLDGSITRDLSQTVTLSEVEVNHLCDELSTFIEPCRDLRISKVIKILRSYGFLVVEA